MNEAKVCGSERETPWMQATQGRAEMEMTKAKGRGEAGSGKERPEMLEGGVTGAEVLVLARGRLTVTLVERNIE